MYKQNVVLFLNSKEYSNVHNENSIIDIIHPEIFERSQIVNLFPFGSVDPQSNIVVYGAGRVGNQCYR